VALLGGVLRKKFGRPLADLVTDRGAGTGTDHGACGAAGQGGADHAADHCAGGCAHLGIGRGA